MIDRLSGSETGNGALECSHVRKFQGLKEWRPGAFLPLFLPSFCHLSLHSHGVSTNDLFCHLANSMYLTSKRACRMERDSHFSTTIFHASAKPIIISLARSDKKKCCFQVFLTIARYSIFWESSLASSHYSTSEISAQFIASRFFEYLPLCVFLETTSIFVYFVFFSFVF